MDDIDPGERMYPTVPLEERIAELERENSTLKGSLENAGRQLLAKGVVYLTAHEVGLHSDAYRPTNVSPEMVSAALRAFDRCGGREEVSMFGITGAMREAIRAALEVYESHAQKP